MRREPTARKNCAECGKPIPKTAGRYGDPDGFCSSRCCRKWNGTSLDVDKEHVRTSALAASIEGGFRDRDEAA